MQTANILTLAADYRRTDRAMLRTEDEAQWKAAHDKCLKTQSQLLRSKPAIYKEASALLDFIAGELSCWGYDALANQLKGSRVDLKKGCYRVATWTFIDLVAQHLAKMIPYDPELRPLRRGLRAVCDFIKAEGGRPDARNLSVRLI
ncbi:MAG: hypothetical protein NVSMB26_04620 [Beijerinckiaceae bacterium]